MMNGNDTIPSTQIYWSYKMLYISFFAWTVRFPVQREEKVDLHVSELSKDEGAHDLPNPGDQQSVRYVHLPVTNPVFLRRSRYRVPLRVVLPTMLTANCKVELGSWFTWRRSFIEMLNVNMFIACMGNRKFIFVPTKARHLIFLDNWIQHY
jgi:hypothetical protein